MIALNILRDMGGDQKQKAHVWKAMVGLSGWNPQARISQISNKEDRDRGQYSLINSLVGARRNVLSLRPLNKAQNNNKTQKENRDVAI